MKLEFDPKYHEAEDKFRMEATRLHEQNDAIQADIRRDVDLPDERREESYIASYKGISGSFDKLANTFAGTVEEDRRALAETVYAGTGDKFSEHLTALANVPDAQLSTLIATAGRTGQKDLERAVALTSLERHGHSPLFEEWAQANTETADALKRLRGLPDSDRLRTRTLAMRPFKASARALEPKPEDKDRVSSHAASQEAAKAAFFNRPRRQIGRRTL